MWYEFIAPNNYSDMNKKELRAEIDRLSSTLVEVKSELEMTKRLYDSAKMSLAIEQENVKTLASILTEFQPREVQDNLATCQRGEWCDACVYHQIVRVDHGIGYGERTEDIDICMKGLACKNFVNKSERED